MTQEQAPQWALDEIAQSCDYTNWSEFRIDHQPSSIAYRLGQNLARNLAKHEPELAPKDPRSLVVAREEAANYCGYYDPDSPDADENSSVKAAKAAFERGQQEPQWIKHDGS